MMMHLIPFSRFVGPRRANRALIGLLLVLFSATAWGGGGGVLILPGTDTNGTVNTCSEGEEIVSLPIVQDSSGLTLVGSLAEIRALVLSVEGAGTIQLQRLPNGLVAVTLMGAYRLELDRANLARTSVQLLFRGGQRFQGGVAQLSILGSAPILLPAERVHLPLARLAGSGKLGVGLELDVVGVRPNRVHAVALLERERVIWEQRGR